MMRILLPSLILSATAFHVPFPSARSRLAAGVVSPGSPLRVSQLSSTESTVDNLGVEDSAAAPAFEAVPVRASEEGAAAVGAPKRVERERYTMFIGNLDFDLTEGDIMDLVSQHAEVKLVSLPRDKTTGVSRGFCFVDVASEEQLQQATAALDKSMVGTREIRVNKSVPKDQVERPAYDVPQVPEGCSRIYCANLAFETTEHEIKEFFQQYGEVLEVYVPMNRARGLNKGYAFVTMKDEEVASAIERTSGAMFQGRELIVNLSLAPGEKAPRRERRTTNMCKLFVGNLSFYTIEETLIELFEEFGTVVDCYLPKDMDRGGNTSRGFGFVTMAREEAMQAMKELDGCEIDGRSIQINEAQQKRQRF